MTEDLKCFIWLAIFPAYLLLAKNQLDRAIPYAGWVDQERHVSIEIKSFFSLVLLIVVVRLIDWSATGDMHALRFLLIFVVFMGVVLIMMHPRIGLIYQRGPKGLSITRSARPILWIWAITFYVFVTLNSCF